MGSRINLIFELPFYSSFVGGITETIKLAERLGASVRFQRKAQSPINIPVPYTIGMSNRTFPECDVCITYSDNPYLNALVYLPQVHKVFVYMMSYGMSYKNERHNALHHKVTCLCTTEKIEQAIIADGGNPIRVGFALDMDDMIDLKDKRGNFLAIMYHDMPSKRYDLAVKVADELFANGIIEGVITFGCLLGYDKHKEPDGLVAFYPDAKRETVIEIFNNCKCFLMPSVSEGLSLTPIEATLCGCVSVICDGAIGEIFFGDNCIIAMPDDFVDISTCVTDAMTNFDAYSETFKTNMQSVVKNYTWNELLSKISLRL